MFKCFFSYSYNPGIKNNQNKKKIKGKDIKNPKIKENFK